MLNSYDVLTIGNGFFPVKAERLKLERDVHAQIWGQILGKTKSAVPFSECIDDGFQRPFGPFGLETLQKEVDFKRHVQRHIDAGARHINVSTTD
jgi:hypothetical protein